MKTNELLHYDTKLGEALRKLGEATNMAVGSYASRSYDEVVRDLNRVRNVLRDAEYAVNSARSAQIRANPLSVLPKNAGEWQLYSSMPGSNIVASNLSKALVKRVKAALDEGDTSYARAEQIRDEMFELMGKQRKYGAMDTEPRGVLRYALEQAFFLERELY